MKYLKGEFVNRGVLIERKLERKESQYKQEGLQACTNGTTRENKVVSDSASRKEKKSECFCARFGTIA